MNVYIYYDVPSAIAAEMVAKIRAMQAMLTGRASRIGLFSRLDDKATSQTWMEVYEDVADDFDARLVQAMAVHGHAPGDRHVERFERIA